MDRLQGDRFKLEKTWEDIFGVGKNADNLADIARQQRWEDEAEANQKYYEMRSNSA